MNVQNKKTEVIFLKWWNFTMNKYVLLFWLMLHKILITSHIKFIKKFYMSLLEMFSLQFIMRLVMQDFV